MVPTCNTPLRVALALLLMASIMATATPIFAIDEEPSAKPESAQAETEAPAEAADPFKVPEGTPDELLGFIQKIGNMRPERQDMASVISFVKESRTAMVKAADKILASPKVTDDQFNMAVRAKLEALAILLQTQDPSAMEMLKAFPKQLKDLNKPELARAIESQLLSMELAKAAFKAPDAKPLKEVVEQINTFVGDKPDMASLGLIMRTSSILGQVDKKEAITFCERFGKLLAKSDVPEVVEQAKVLEGTARRLNLVGKPMKLVGKTLDGSEFDWDSYKGKVVLVQFWATWCKPCREELPSILADYETYHKKGFEIVGISLDYNLAPLEEFLKEEPLPWTIVYNGPRGDNQDRELPNATYYGVSGIPELILVGRDGNVIATGLRGPALGLELETLFGDSEEKKPETK